MRINKSFVGFIFLFVNSIICHNYVIAQRSTSIQGQQTYFNKFANNIDRVKRGEAKHVAEGYYLSNEWKKGVIYAKPKVEIKNLQLRYCVLNQEFEFTNEKDTFSINKPELIDSVRLDNKCFIYTQYYDSNNLESAYFEVLSSKGFVLLQKYNCRFVRGKKQVSSFEEPTDDSYVITTQFYLKESEGPASLLPRSKSDFFNVFGDQKDEIKKFMKTNKLKRSNSEDLSKVFNYYNYLNMKS
ncbi:hypothetical protein EV201_1185 [Ancylomarina subtilis]|uniref:Uncharacterized protein n=1 Tax=Ancylomarina subtilis TaxID=1639035 RepID=A0A4Q7VKE9_9BACT|nr:hypothetical protein [Ancylomarina subtilis]RZT96547.1 hypothetical protein EV201_1185 [Ancylomarina subtilis]